MRKALVLCLLMAVGCCTTQKTHWEAIQSSWEALKPYAQAGIATATDVGPQGRAELLKEAEELSKSITQEVLYASE
jgi:hypothetical protein